MHVERNRENPWKNTEKLMKIMKNTLKKIEKKGRKPMEKQRQTKEHSEEH